MDEECDGRQARAQRYLRAAGGRDNGTGLWLHNGRLSGTVYLTVRVLLSLWLCVFPPFASCEPGYIC